MAKEEEVNMEEVEVKVVAEADVLVWIGARQRGRSSTLLDSFRLESIRLIRFIEFRFVSARQRGRSSTSQDARPAPISDRGMQGRRQQEREQVNNMKRHERRWAADPDALVCGFYTRPNGPILGLTGVPARGVCGYREEYTLR